MLITDFQIIVNNFPAEMKEEFQVMISFARDSTHLREAGAALAICGAPVAGFLIRKFFYIGQVDKCRDCVEEASRRKYNEKK